MFCVRNCIFFSAFCSCSVAVDTMRYFCSFFIFFQYIASLKNRFRVSIMDFDSPSTPSICAMLRGKAPTTSMSFHEDGVHLFVASETDTRLRLVDTIRGTSDFIPTKLEREGVQLVRATHHNQCVLYTTSPQRNHGTNSIYYLSLYDNKVLRQFSPSNASSVHTLSMSPVDDLFLSASSDRTVRLYDIAAPKCIAEMSLPTQGVSTQHGLTTLDTNSVPCAAFDSSGLVFAASTRILSPWDHVCIPLDYCFHCISID